MRHFPQVLYLKMKRCIAYMNEDEEQHNFFLSSTATSDVWTGLNDLNIPGMFSWSDEHMATFTYWAPGEPNNHHGFSEDCVEMLHRVRGMTNNITHP